MGVCVGGGGRGGRGGVGAILNAMALIITNSVLGTYRYTITERLTLIVCCCFASYRLTAVIRSRVSPP